MNEMLQYAFIRNALAAGFMVAVSCSYLSVFIVFRRVVFVGITLAQISTAGVAVALLLHLDPTVCALAFSMAAVVLLGSFSFRKRVPKEAVIGTGYVAASSSAVLLMTVSPLAHHQMLDILFGNILTVERSYLVFLLIVLGAVGAVHIVFRRQFLFCTFDPEGAFAFGYRTRRWEVLLYLTLGVVISISIRAVGALLCFAFLVVPAVTGLVLVRRVKAIFAVGAVTALICTFLGVYLSFVFDLPSGPVVCILLVALALAARATTWLAE